MSALVRLLGPLKPGEERLSRSITLPGATRKNVTNEKCEELLQHIRYHLNGAPDLELVYGPKILRELVTGDGVDSLVITAIAIVRKVVPDGTLRSATLTEPGKGTGSIALVGEEGPESVVPLTGDWAKPRPMRFGFQKQQVVGNLGDAHLHAASYDEMREAQDKVAALFEDYLFRTFDQRNEALREIADKMLADGTQGIVMIQVRGKIEEPVENHFEMIDYTKLGLHPRVPFGHIYEFPSEDAFLAWLERTD